MNGMLDASHTMTSVVDFTAIGAVDALWVDQELYGTLSESELTGISDFVSTGKRAVLIGENSGWKTWNNSLMSIAGGSYASGCYMSVGAPSSSSSLTSGVGTVQGICSNKLDNSAGVDMIFDNDMAGIYKVGAGEVLVILDSNWADDKYMIQEDNAVFAKNVVNWLGEPPVSAAVPLPASVLFLGAGLGGLASLSRRKS